MYTEKNATSVWEKRMTTDKILDCNWGEPERAPH